MKKVACIVGTRPQLIKHAVLLPQLEKYFQVVSINTMQHYDNGLNTSIIEDLYEISPFINLRTDSSLNKGERLGSMVMALSKDLETIQPNAVLVYGDTDSTLAGALAAHKSGILLTHVEAGERSHNLTMPEENNRIMTDLLSSILFCASHHALKNLEETNPTKTAMYVGDLMKDLVKTKEAELTTPLFDQPYYYCTIHRNYNQSNPVTIKKLLDVLNGLRFRTFFPLHPATRQSLLDQGISLQSYTNINFIEPVNYTDSIRFQKFAKAVITDSGGMQKEAYWLKVPCITVRKETEWIETLKGNWNQLIHEDVAYLQKALETMPIENMHKNDLYGNGKTSCTIAEKLASLIN
jgi:UDP-N-acetylglucosamine 2-epimerase